MSFEYQVGLSSPLPSLSSLTLGLAELGLVVTESSDNYLSLSKPPIDAIELRRWGGDVQLMRETTRLVVICNGGGVLPGVMEKIVHVLAQEGIEGRPEEL